MDIIVPYSIRKKEFGGTVPDEAQKIFGKIKEKPDLAETISLKGLPARTTLHKFYATSDGGHRRLLFFCRRPQADPKLGDSDEWVLLFYRNKGDLVGDTMSRKNPEFSKQFWNRMLSAIDDVASDTPSTPRCETF